MPSKSILAIMTIALLAFTSCGAILGNEDVGDIETEATVSADRSEEGSAAETATPVETTSGDKVALGESDEAVAPDETDESESSSSGTMESTETTQPPESTTSTEPAESVVDVFEIGIGDCFAAPLLDEVLDVVKVPCTEEHKYQAYAVFDVREGLFPAEDEMYDLASEGCLDEFEPYVGTPYPESDLYVTWLEPTQESWSDGDREIVCEVYLEDELLTADAEGSGL